MSTPKCTYNIRSQLTSFAPGGTWTYVGYNSNSDSGPWGSNPATPLVTDAPGTVITRGDDFAIITDGKSFGYYKFNYTLNGTTVSLTIRVIDDTITAGTSRTITISTGSSPINLLTLLGASAGGVWTDINNAGAAFSNNILTPTSLTPGNTYRFRYNLNNSYTPGGCSSCPPLESTAVVIIASNTFTARLDAADDTCTVSMALKHPDNNTSNLAKITIASDALLPVATIKKVVTDCNSVVVHEEVLPIMKLFPVNIGGIMTANTQLQPSGYFETLTLNNSAGGTITVPLAPSGANQAVFTGPGGDIDATRLTYQGVNESIFRSAIASAIRNYLATQNLFLNTNYLISTSLQNGYFTLLFTARHNPVGPWLGYNTLTYKVTSSSGNTTLAANAKFSSETPLVMTYQGSPCPASLTISPALTDSVVDLTTTTYTNIALKASSMALNINPGSVTSGSCPAKLLTAVPLNCNGSLSYLWDYNAATSNSIRVTTKGKYKVTVTCTNPAGSVDLEYDYV